jgi:adenylate cyclase class 2
MNNSLSTNIEFEAKSYPIDKKTYRENLKRIGATLIRPERKMRRAIFNKDHYPQLLCDYIRVRDEGNVIRLSAKTHAREGGSLSDQEEIDVEISDYDKTIQILELTGYKFNSYQETLRETWVYKDAEIEIDTWPGLETYTEIEARSEESVHKMFSILGLDWDTKIITSVVEIYMKVYSLSKEEVLDRLSYITFEKKPFKNIKNP